MNAPIFIVGANRSGTTLLRLILNAHPRIGIPEEIVYFGSVMAGVPIENWRNPALSDEAYSAFVKEFVLKTCEPLGRIDREALVEKILADKPYDFKKPYETVLQNWASRHGKNRWGEKTPGNLFYADILYEMFPVAKFIHLVRDPRAGVSSMMKTSFFSDDVVFNALSRHKFMTKGRAILERSVPPWQRTTLRYEDLVLNPENTIRNLCDFLEESFEPCMMTFYKDSSRYMKRDAATSFNKEATKPISADMLEKWRKNLSPAAIAQIQDICRKEMVEFNYPIEKEALDFQRRIEILFKWLYWQFQVWRNRQVRHFTVKSPMFARLQGRLNRIRRDTSSEK